MSDMNALELADSLDEKWFRWKGHQVTELDAADMLRHQHEAIVMLREALTLIGETDAVDAALDPQRAVRVAQQALKDTEGL